MAESKAKERVLEAVRDLPEDVREIIVGEYRIVYRLAASTVQSSRSRPSLKGDEAHGPRGFAGGRDQAPQRPDSPARTEIRIQLEAAVTREGLSLALSPSLSQRDGPKIESGFGFWGGGSFRLPQENTLKPYPFARKVEGSPDAGSSRLFVDGVGPVSPASLVPPQERPFTTACTNKPQPPHYSPSATPTQ